MNPKDSKYFLKCDPLAYTSFLRFKCPAIFLHFAKEMSTLNPHKSGRLWNIPAPTGNSIGFVGGGIIL
jgi:hypothetical protein